MEKLISLLDKFIDANKTVKELYLDDWRERMKLYQLMIADQMKSGRLDTIIAAVALVGQYSDNKNTRLWILAAAVEMIEEG